MSRPLAGQSSRPTQPCDRQAAPNLATHFIFMLLRPLCLSLRSFASCHPLFSMACSLFGQKRGGGVGCLKTLFELHEIQTLFSPPCAILAGFVLNSSLSCSEAGQP